MFDRCLLFCALHGHVAEWTPHNQPTVGTNVGQWHVVQTHRCVIVEEATERMTVVALIRILSVFKIYTDCICAFGFVVQLACKCNWNLCVTTIHKARTHKITRASHI